MPIEPPPHEAPLFTVVAAIIQHGGRVLICQRRKDDSFALKWEFPGGKCWKREAAGACLRRELREELGIEVEVGASLGIFRHSYTHFHVTMHAFECRIRRGRPRANEHTDLRWVIPSRLAAYPMGRVARRIADVVAGEPALARRPILRK